MVLEITIYKNTVKDPNNVTFIGSTTSMQPKIEIISSESLSGLAFKIATFVQNNKSLIKKVEITFVQPGIEKIGNIFSSPIQNFVIKGLEEEEKELFLIDYFEKMKPV